MIGDSNDEINFSYKLLLTETLVLRLHKAFGNNSSANIKLLKPQLSKMVQVGEFLPLSMKLMDSLADSLADSFGKESESKFLPNSKKDIQELLVNAGLKSFGKNLIRDFQQSLA